MDISNEDLGIFVTAVIASGVPHSELAGLMEVAESTVERWKNGAANPHPNVREMVVRKGFQTAVKKALEDGVSNVELQREFGVAESTVHRWASGTANPLHLAKLRILEKIKGLRAS